MGYLINLFLMLFVFSLAACGGGGGSSGANPNQSTLTVTSGDVLTLPVGAFRQYSVSGGVPPYQVASSEPAIAVGNIVGNSLSIGAIAGGQASIRIYDYKGTTVSTQVTVGSSLALSTTAPSNISLSPPGFTSCTGVSAIGGSATYAIAGGAAPYSVVSSNTAVVAVTLVDGSHWQAQSKGIGAATILIRDAGGSAPVQIAVNTAGDGTKVLSVSPEKLLMPTGYEAEVTVSGGVGPYRAAGGVPAAIQVTPACSDDGRFKIKGNLASKLDIGFVDSIGSSVKTEVEINTGTPSFRVSPAPITVSENSAGVITLGLYGFLGDTATSASSGRVCIFISDPTYFALEPGQAQCSTYSASNRTFNLVTGSRGSRCVSANTVVEVLAVDSASQAATGTITIADNGIACNLGSVAVTPTTVTVQPTLTNDVTISSGSGAYVVTSSNPAVVTAVVVGNRLTLTGGVTLGTATVTVTDAATNQSATVSVTNGSAGAFVVSPTAITVQPTLQNAAVIIGGYGSYTVTSSDPAVATAAAVADRLTITGGATRGVASISVTDVATGQTRIVTVTNGSTVGALVLSQTVAAPGVGSDRFVTIAISGGSGNYVATTFNGRIAVGSIDKNVLKIEGITAGSTSVLVTDTTTQQTALVAVQVVDAELRLSNGTLSLAVGESQSVVVSGGSGGFVVTSNDANVMATISGRDITVTRLAAGASATVTVRDTRFTTLVTLTVN